jgi:integrase
MPIYPGRRPGTFRVVIWVRGKAVEAIFEGSKSEARDHEARMRLEHRVTRGRSPRSVARFSRFCVEEYAPHAQARLASSTWRTRQFILATLVEHFGDLPLSDFSTERIDAFTQARLEAKLEPSYINTDLTVLGAILRWARVDRKEAVGEFRIRMLRTDRRRVHCWTRDEVEALLSTARRDDPELEAMLVFLVNTGCRKGESIAAEWSWVDTRAKMLRIPVTKYWRPKSRRPREVPLSDALWRMLRDRLRTSRWIFPTQFGERHRGFPDPRFRAVRDAAGLKGGPHCTRHTYASHFLQKVPDLFELAAMLGHSHTRTTELYAHLLPGHHEKARNAVNLGGTLARRRAS